jgi:hypothetical protein
LPDNNKPLDKKKKEAGNVMENNSDSVEGEIVFREIISPFSGVTGYVFLEDVSRADFGTLPGQGSSLPGPVQDCTSTTGKI